jgi:hypothetical protein
MAQKLNVSEYMKTAHWLKQYEIEAKKDGIHNKKTGELLVSFLFEIDPATAVLPSGGAAPSQPPSGGSESKPKKPKAPSGSEGGAGSEELPGSPASGEGTEASSP